MRAAKVDDNHRAVGAVFRGYGATLQSLAMVGHGCPDWLVGYMGRNRLVEVKDGGKEPARRALTPDQKDWHALWRGEVDIVESVQDAEALIMKWGTE